MIQKLLVFYKYFLFVSLIFISGNLLAQQVQIGGVVNHYAVVLSITDCVIQVDSAQDFKAGDRVLIIQMKGASLNLANDTSYGQVLRYNAAGLFDVGTVKAVINDSIYLERKLQHPYDVSKNVQIVGIKPATTTQSNAAITAKPWNGSTGGIVFIDVDDSLYLNHSINVQGQGYNGGDYSLVKVACNYNSYACEFNTGYGGEKGESFFKIGKNNACKGASGIGGGGGNAGNTGGGGGSNVGSGGIGGKEVGFGSGACLNPLTGGRGGRPIDYDTVNAINQNNTLDRLFFGGGGGGAQQNNMPSDGYKGINGSNGGGIIFIKCPNLIVGSNVILNADANHVVDTAGRDGAGGGGAGGSIALYTDHVVNNLVLTANGGNGGHIGNATFNSICHGPGGGGGGGLLWIKSNSQLPNISFTAKAGLAGKNVNISSNCYNTNYGATDGSSGGILTGMRLFKSQIAAFCPKNRIIAVDDSYTLIQAKKLLAQVNVNDTSVTSYKTSICKNPLNGSISLIGNDIEYQPFGSFSGKDSFCYTICQTNAPFLCDTAWVKIDVIPNPYVLFVVNDTFNVNELDTSFHFPLLNDAIQKRVTLTLLGTASIGDADLIDSITVRYIAGLGASFDSVAYQVCFVDSTSLCANAYIYFKVLIDSTAPIAVNDSVKLETNDSVLVDILANDTSLKDVVISVKKQPIKGVVTVLADGTITYKLLSDSFGLDSFMYTICQTVAPFLCDSAWVYLDADEPIKYPIAVNDTFNVIAGIEYSSNILANDLFISASPSIKILQNPNNGSAVLASQLYVDYTANISFQGLDSFQYQVCNNNINNDCDTAWVYYQVALGNRPPIAVNDTFYVDFEEEVLVEPLVNDYDLDADSISLRSIIEFPSNGVLSIFIDSFYYKSDKNFSGIDTMQYSICDNQIPSLCDTAYVFFYVQNRPKLIVPNGISPNNDGLNDKLVVKNIDYYSHINLTIFNRWGQSVYNHSDYDNTWAGLNDTSEPLPDGTYFYVIVIEDSAEKLTGYVVIKR